ncbi:uncharacterized protein LOC141876388 isoform X3 [Acropora palmata]|uniref:uncharacterized protein LOC141876388 isoform X3 n=1 Tax=Acropora palmata TaxID=6131 RepID=UPI003D9FB4A8
MKYSSVVRLGVRSGIMVNLKRPELKLVDLEHCCFIVDTTFCQVVWCWAKKLLKLPESLPVLGISLSVNMAGTAMEIMKSRWKALQSQIKRMNILKDAMAEFLTDPPIADLIFPLDVTFIGEEAADYGRPRKEFLGAFIRELRDQLFDEEYILTTELLSWSRANIWVQYAPGRTIALFPERGTTSKAPCWRIFHS